MAFHLKKGEEAVKYAETYVETRWGNLLVYRLDQLKLYSFINVKIPNYLIQGYLQKVGGDHIVVVLRLLLYITTRFHESFVVVPQRLQCPLLTNSPYLPWHLGH